MKGKFTALIIMDGFGERKERSGNAIKIAGTPVLDKLEGEYPHTLIGASGMDVGLPKGQMGNSEVGHLNMGAGRIVYQELTKITKSIEDGDFFKNPVLIEAVRNAKDNGKKLHLMGLCSDGGVHSHLNHLYAILELAKKNDLKEVYIHCFMDGRDVPPNSGKGYIEELECEVKKIGVGQIATVMGRYYSMDRDNRWNRVKRAYDAMVYGKGLEAASAAEAMQNSYDKEEWDEFVEPTVIVGIPSSSLTSGRTAQGRLPARLQRKLLTDLKDRCAACILYA